MEKNISVNLNLEQTERRHSSIYFTLFSYIEKQKGLLSVLSLPLPMMGVLAENKLI